MFVPLSRSSRGSNPSSNPRGRLYCSTWPVPPHHQNRGTLETASHHPLPPTNQSHFPGVAWQLLEEVVEASCCMQTLASRSSSGPKSPPQQMRAPSQKPFRRRSSRVQLPCPPRQSPSRRERSRRQACCPAPKPRHEPIGCLHAPRHPPVARSRWRHQLARGRRRSLPPPRVFLSRSPSASGVEPAHCSMPENTEFACPTLLSRCRLRLLPLRRWRSRPPTLLSRCSLWRLVDAVLMFSCYGRVLQGCGVVIRATPNLPSCSRRFHSGHLPRPSPQKIFHMMMASHSVTRSLDYQCNHHFYYQ